jgi:hypothetical protein
MRGSFERILLTLLLSSFFVNFTRASNDTPVGVIQYNVKGRQGGWIEEGGVMDVQVHLIAEKIKASAVDFVALEQASEMAGSSRTLISAKLAENGLEGWNTVVSSCNKDATQLAFSTKWELVPGTSSSNPLQNGTTPQRGWVIGGCEPGGDGRPYNIAYFRNKETDLKLLVVVVHLPHCRPVNPEACIATWN